MMNPSNAISHLPANKNHYSKWFVLVTAIFVTCLITANIIAVKLITIAGLILPAAVIIFPISYIVGDVLTEVYGYRQARQVIWLGFLCNLIAVAAIWLGGLLPPAPFWPGQEAYDTILGFTPGLLAASFIAMEALFLTVVTQWLVKSIYEAAATPLTYLAVNFLKRQEGLDMYDYETRFNPLLITK